MDLRLAHEEVTAVLGAYTAGTMKSGAHAVFDSTRVMRRVMLSPVVIILLPMALFPFIFTIALTFSKVNLSNGFHMSWNGVYYWAKLFRDARFWNSSAGRT